MIYLILDTNIWIYMANGFNSITDRTDSKSDKHFELYEKLKDKVDQKEFIILTSTIIKSEWERNKITAQNLIKTIEKEKREAISFLVDKKSELGDLFKSACKKVNDSYNEKIELNQQHLKNVEDLLNSSENVNVSDEIKLQLANLAITKTKAPFLKNKNNFADAAILFSSIDYLKMKLTPLDYAVFVSNNYTEFGESKTSSKFHKDLKEHVKGINIEYHRHFSSLLDLTEELQYQIEAFHEYIREQHHFFYCCTPNCEGYEEIISYGYLDETIRFVNEEEQIDPDQLSLFESGAIEKNPSIKYTREGSCLICGTNHIECPYCETLMFDHNENDQYYCEYCNLSFQTSIDQKNKDKIIHPIDESEVSL